MVLGNLYIKVVCGPLKGHGAKTNIRWYSVFTGVDMARVGEKMSRKVSQ